MDLNRATEVNAEVRDAIRDMFEYHEWDQPKRDAGRRVRDALIAAVEAIVANVPPGPDRTVAIRKLRDCRMDCNSAISHEGKY